MKVLGTLFVGIIIGAGFMYLKRSGQSIVQIVDYTVSPATTRTEPNDGKSNGMWFSYKKWKTDWLMEKSSVGCLN